jgi:hypothetical protein
MSALSHDDLKHILDYNPDTGIFVWSVSIGNIKAGSVAGTKRRNGYIQIGIYGKVYFAHRLAWFYMTGNNPKENIDHINKNKEDNSFINLRESSYSQNMCNIDSRSDNKLGIKGVCKLKKFSKNKKYRAQIQINKKKIMLGDYETVAEAHEAYKNAAIMFHGKFARF